MKIKLAIASIAAAASFATMGSAFAGELYSASEGSFSPVAVTSASPVATWDGGGELHTAVERQTARFMASAEAAPSVASIYALGGELYLPARLTDGSAINTNLAE